jgi:diguanylate cyclase (GGDEF)-like protein
VPATVRDLLDLLPRPGRRIHHISCAICVQVLTLAMIAVHSVVGAVTMVVLAIIQMLFVHVAAAQCRRALVAERDTREQVLRAELAEAHTDTLTGLPTRRFVYRHLNSASPDTAVTVAFCDADALKAINDQLSHAAGDDYLAVVAERLGHVVLPDDIVVRLGGDEFAVATSQTPHQLADALARALHEPAVIAGISLPVRVSVGIFATTGGDAHTALGCAEAAMRTAKRQRSFIEHYDPNRDGIPLPAGIRPPIRPRDQRSTPPAQP